MYSHGPNCLQGPVSRTTACSSGRLSEQLPEFRADLVERVRREIAEGRYETPEKWEFAFNRLLQVLDVD
jgi:hypothetical protein